jgi:hypothetical protein
MMHGDMTWMWWALKAPYLLAAGVFVAVIAAVLWRMKK